MNSTLDSILRDVAEDTFATLAFLMPMGEEEQAFCVAEQGINALVAGADVAEPGHGRAFSRDRAAHGPQRLSARVDFSGPFTGCIVLTIDARILEPLTANMLGLLGVCSTSTEQQFDALRELSNVVCGNLLPKVATPRDVFKVHSPEILPPGSDATTIDGRSPESQITLWVEGGRTELLLFTDHLIPVSAA